MTAKDKNIINNYKHEQKYIILTSNLITATIQNILTNLNNNKNIQTHPTLLYTKYS